MILIAIKHKSRYAILPVQPFVDEDAIALIPDAIIVRSGHAASLIYVDIGASRSTLPNFRRGGSSIERLMCDPRV